MNEKQVTVNINLLRYKSNKTKLYIAEGSKQMYKW